MTRDAIGALSDTELEQVGVWAREETRDRAARRKHETIAKIRDLAAVVGVHVKISGARGRPPASGQGSKGMKPGSGPVAVSRKQ